MDEIDSDNLSAAVEQLLTAVKLLAKRVSMLEEVCREELDDQVEDADLDAMY
jgi:hypothetical protein